MLGAWYTEAEVEAAVKAIRDSMDWTKGFGFFCEEITGFEGRLSVVTDSLAEAVASYKAAVVRANPDVMEELLSGDTIESVDESLEKARALIGKVRQGLETEISLARVPAGAPERRTPDLSSLSPREKIQYAIGGKK